MNKHAALWALGVLVVLGGIYMFSQGIAPKETGPIQIGFIGPLTGDVAAIGTLNKAAIEIAVEEINAEGGVDGRPLQVTYEDGQCSATAGLNAAQKLLAKDVTAILGGLCSSETAAFGPVAMDNKVIVLSYGSSAPSLTGLGTYFFRDYPSDSYLGIYAAEYAYVVLGARTAATFYHVSDYGTGLSSAFEKRFAELGGEIVASEGNPQESRDYRSSLSKVKSLNPDIMFSVLYTEGAIAAINQASALGMTTPILGSETLDDPKLQMSVPKNVSFTYLVPHSNVTDEFKTKLEAKTGSEGVPATVVNAYDAVYVLAEAIEKAGGTDPDKLEAALRKTDYQGISGHITFDENGDLKTADYIVKKFENGTASEI